MAAGILRFDLCEAKNNGFTPEERLTKLHTAPIHIFGRRTRAHAAMADVERGWRAQKASGFLHNILGYSIFLPQRLLIQFEAENDAFANSEKKTV